MLPWFALPEENREQDRFAARTIISAGYPALITSLESDPAIYERQSETVARVIHDAWLEWAAQNRHDHPHRCSWEDHDEEGKDRHRLSAWKALEVLRAQTAIVKQTVRVGNELQERSVVFRIGRCEKYGGQTQQEMIPLGWLVVDEDFEQYRRAAKETIGVGRWDEPDLIEPKPISAGPETVSWGDIIAATHERPGKTVVVGMGATNFGPEDLGPHHSLPQEPEKWLPFAGETLRLVVTGFRDSATHEAMRSFFWPRLVPGGILAFGTATPNKYIIERKPKEAVDG